MRAGRLYPLAPMSRRHDFFATCAPGLEPLLHEEVGVLGLTRPERQVGGVAFVGTVHDAWRANLWLRTAIRVLLRVARFPARDADALYAGAREVAWEEFLSPEGTLVVDARSRSSELAHTQFIEQRVKDAVVDRFRDRHGVRPSVDKDDPDLRVNAHLFQDRVTLSVDTSGHSLHRRGWRVHQGRAPLAETTAAAMVLASGWNRRAPLVDPFSGTGTIVIEAGLLAGCRAPGLLRTFPFERWPGHDAPGFERVQAEARERAAPLPARLRLVGYDLDQERVEEARANATAAGLGDQVAFEVADARAFAPRSGWNAALVTNPPYGQRLGEEDDLFALYRDFGDALRSRAQGSSLTLLTGDPRLRKSLGFAHAKRTPILNGGIECELVQVERIGD